MGVFISRSKYYFYLIWRKENEEEETSRNTYCDCDSTYDDSGDDAECFGGV